MAEGQKSCSPAIYEIKIKGHLDDRWAEWLYDLSITRESDGTTTLSGPLSDQTVLHSVLERIRDMNLPLVSVTQLEPEPQDDSKSKLEEGANDV